MPSWKNEPIEVKLVGPIFVTVKHQGDEDGNTTAVLSAILRKLEELMVSNKEVSTNMSALSDKIQGLRDDVATLAAAEAVEDADAVARTARIAELEALVAELQGQAVTPADLEALDALKAELAAAKIGA